MRVIFIVRCHGDPDEEIEEMIESEISQAVNMPGIGWGILTIGRQYFHDVANCEGHPEPIKVCDAQAT